MSGFSEQHWSHIDARIEFPFEPSTRAEARLGWRLAAALTEHLSRQPEVRAWLEEMNNRELTDELERTIAEQAVQVCRAHNLPSAFIAALLQQVAIIEVLRKVTDNDVYLELGLYDPVTAKTRQAVKAQLLFVLDRTIELIQQGELERLEGENFFSQVLAWCNAIYQQLTERVTLIQEEMELPPGRKRKDIELREQALILNRIGEGDGPVSKQKLAGRLLPGRQVSSARRTIYQWLDEAERLVGLKPPTLRGP